MYMKKCFLQLTFLWELEPLIGTFWGASHTDLLHQHFMTVACWVVAGYSNGSTPLMMTVYQTENTVEWAL